MNGITIVEEHLCRVVELSALIGIGIFMTILCGGALLLYRLTYKNLCVDKKSKSVVIVCSILLVIMYVVFWVFQINNYNKTHIEYTVTIDDSVSFNDFHEKYEIVSVNGNEYRVVEK
jgi:Ca2+/H+ antiporter